MQLKSIEKFYNQTNISTSLTEILLKDSAKAHLKGAYGSIGSFLSANIFNKAEKPLLFIAKDKEKAIYYLNELEHLIDENQLLFFPSSYRRAYEIEKIDNANVLLRAEVLNTLNGAKKNRMLITYADALFEKVVTRKVLQKNTLNLKVGEEITLDFLNQVLFEYQFNRVDFVTEPGEFSVRGGIVDVFSFSHDNPYRIEFFANEVDSIRDFDIETQLSKSKLKTIQIVPNVDNKFDNENRESLLSYISSKYICIIDNLDWITNRIESNFLKSEQKFTELSEDIKHQKPNKLFVNKNQFLKEIEPFSILELSSKAYFKSDFSTEIKTQPQLSFNKDIDLLINHLKENQKEEITNHILCVNPKQVERFKTIFEDKNIDIPISYSTETIHEGFIDYTHKKAFITDHQFFERYHKFNLKKGFKKSESLTLKELTSLEKGDYVTHIDYGVGVFGGLQKIDVNGKKQEALKLIYQNKDVLYVSIHALHKISKFNGKDGKQPKINKLGSPAWSKLKKKTQSKVKEIAYDLIQLYAKRKLKKGFAYAPDTYIQTELEASFIYEDTPDQFIATQAVKQDMESETPMDRLVCGDVGFGKTEVAIRAAVKAAADGKQVAVLVPTTVLAFQHYKSFKSRIGDLPVNVDYLNRFRTVKEKKEILKNLSEGKLDILIGTHALVSRSVVYKDLGLLIIDEEHKFGVSVKDKLKTIKENVDTLTLTATPIPRTLQFSLMAARDLSVIKTPPPNRHPIETHVVSFNEEIIRDAVMYEIQRDGQIFFIHNRIENIKEVAGMIQRLVPDAKVGIGHGQMDGKKLEQLMLSFIDGEFDVLVSTTIIESGLDVPNANTIFINQAQNFGMADLHQMRGRVGRSNKKAFCYLVAPPLTAMTDEARKRLETLEQFSDLGSGLKIAMKDLEIRGAGNLLGGEQSGFINEIGFDAYQKILNETISELKETEFKELYKDEVLQSSTIKKELVKEVQIDTDLEILIPDNYINNIEERLAIYSEINQLKTIKKLNRFEKNIVDRFGKIPNVLNDLLTSVQLKWLAQQIGFEKITLKKEIMLCYFIKNPQSEYYTKGLFQEIIVFMKQHTQLGIFKQKPASNGRPAVVYLRFDAVENVTKAYGILSKIRDAITVEST